MSGQTVETYGLDDALDRLACRVEALSAENEELLRTIGDARRALVIDKNPAMAVALLTILPGAA